MLLNTLAAALALPNKPPTGTAGLTELFARTSQLPLGSSHLFCEFANRPRAIATDTMRHVFNISVLLVAIGTVSCVVESSASNAASNPASLVWVRTADGWERHGTWNLPISRPPTLHPLVVATGQLLISTWALVFFRRDDLGNSPEQSQTSPQRLG